MKKKDWVYCAASVLLLMVTFGLTRLLPSRHDSVLLTINRPTSNNPIPKPPKVTIEERAAQDAERAVEATVSSESGLREALDRIMALKELVAGIDSLDAALNSALHESILGSIRAKDYGAASFLVQEALRTGQPWAFAYAAELAENKNVFCSEIAVSALFQDDSPQARQVVEKLVKSQMALGVPKPLSKEELDRATEGLSPLDALNMREAIEDAASRLPNPHPRDLLNIAASTASPFARQLYEDAFAAASTEQRVDWFINGASFRSGLTDNDPRMAIIWESIVSPEDEALRMAALACMFEERHLQYPGGSDATSRMLYDVMTQGGSDAQVAALNALQAQVEQWSMSNDPSGNLVAMELTLDLGLTSTDEDVRIMAEEILRDLEEQVDREAIAEALTHDFQLLPMLINSIRTDR